VVRQSLPIDNIKALVDYAKANPGKLTHGSSGIGSINQLAAELFKSLTGTKILHVPYKGGPNMITALLSGEIDMAVSPITSALPQIQAGKIKALAVLDNQRTAVMPNVPTTKEAGVDHYVVTSWYGLLAPAGTPREIITRLNKEWNKCAEMADTKERLQKLGIQTLSSTPDQFRDFIKTDIARWAKVVKDANISTLD